MRMFFSYMKQVYLLFLVIADVGTEYVNVTWALTKKPARLGQSVQLSCVITGTDCNSFIKQWIGGPTYQPLCRNSHCLQNSKYNIMQSDSCTYVLEIRDFWAGDGNCDYTCGYGVTNERKRLRITGDSFIYPPNSNNLSKNVTIIDNKIYVSIYMKMVFPSPKCFIFFSNKIFYSGKPETTKTDDQGDTNTQNRSGNQSYSGKNKTEPLKMIKNESTTDIFIHDSTVYGEFLIPSCPTNIRIICYFGSEGIEVYSSKQECGKGQSETSRWIIPTVIVVVASVVFIVACFVVIRKRRNSSRGLSGQNSISHINGDMVPHGITELNDRIEEEVNFL